MSENLGPPEHRQDRRDYGADLAGLNAKLDAVLQKVESEAKVLTQAIGFSDRNTAQLVRLVEEKLNNVKQDVKDVQEAQSADRATFLKALEQMDDRMKVVEHFKTKLIGVAMGVGVVSGGISASVVKLVG